MFWNSKRINVPEVEDSTMFPAVVRDGMTDVLRHFIKWFRIYNPLIPVLAELLRKTGTNKIFDLCSGGGGGITDLLPSLETAYAGKVDVSISDKFPNLKAFSHIEETTAVTPVYKPFDALTEQFPGNHLITMFSSFHHFEPGQALKILCRARDQKVPILIAEGISKNYLLVFAALFLLPLQILLLTPFFRPFRWSRLFFTYMIPLIVIGTVWDGIASIFRLYSKNEIEQMLKAASSPSYSWEYGRKRSGVLYITYIAGFPVP